MSDSVIPDHLRELLLRTDSTWDRLLDEEGALGALNCALGRVLMGVSRYSFNELTASLLAKAIDQLERDGHA